MNPNGRRPTRHMIDGQPMTAAEIAEMLGITKRALEVRKCRLNGCSYQLIVNMYRTNQLGSRHDKAHRHKVHGRWMTVAEAATELGVKPHCLVTWRCTHRDAKGNQPTLEEAYDQYVRFRSGVDVKHPGGPTKYHRVHGKQMTTAEAAKAYRVSETYLRKIMSERKCSLAAAVDQVEAIRGKKAQKNIMRILGY